MIAHNFKVLGHHDLGRPEMNGDVWVHGNFAYVGTWAIPCSGRGVKIVDVTKLRRPELIATAAARRGTSAEDLVVRRVSTASFSGDLLAVGIQRCGGRPRGLNDDGFGLELWNVTNPYQPEKLGEFPVGMGDGGVHELDLFQRGERVYALLAHPFAEWTLGPGEFFIVDVTNPRLPVKVSEWGAADAGFSRGPIWGIGPSPPCSPTAPARAKTAPRRMSPTGTSASSCFDITDPANPGPLTRTRYERARTATRTR